MASTIDDLRRVPLFSGLTDRAIDSIADLATEAPIADGQVLTEEGQPGGTFYLLLDGHVAVERGGRPIAELGPGDFFGEVSLIDGRPRTATVTAATDGRVLVIEREAFAELMERHSAVRLGIVMGLTERIRGDEQEGPI